MAEVTGTGNSDWQAQLNAQKAFEADTRNFQLQMLELQNKANRNKAETEGVSSLIKSRSEAMSYIAQNLK